MKQYVILNKQECNDENYDFSIQVVATQNLINRINSLNKMPVQQVLLIAHTLLLEAHEDKSNIDYLQTFSYEGIDFWCISNKLVDEPYNPEYHVVTWLLPEDY